MNIRNIRCHCPFLLLWEQQTPITNYKLFYDIQHWCCKFSNFAQMWLQSQKSQHHSFSSLPQTGCNPASAFASFSKRLASPPREEEMSRSVARLITGPSDTLASSIPTFPRSLSPPSYSPPASPLEGDVVIPCEFCGVALEEAVVFHHQVRKTLKILWVQPENTDLFFQLLTACLLILACSSPCL